MKEVKILNSIIIALTTVQFLIPSMPQAGFVTTLSATIVFLVPVLTVWKQTISVDVDNAIRKWTWLIVLVAFFGGVTDYINIFHFSAATSQWVRFAITAIATTLNLLSKEILPSDYLKKTQ